MAQQPPAQSGLVGTLTDNTGVSPVTVPKLLKDAIADFLITGAAAIGALNIMGLQDVVAAPQVATFAVAGAAIHALYRLALRWATSD